MKQLEDLDPMPFGKYRGTKLQEIPANYFHWLWSNGKKFETKTDPVAEYIERNLSALKKEHPDGIW